MRTLPFVLSLFVAGCEIGTDTLEPYYPEGATAPTVSGVEPASEAGNVGGGTVTISGGGFGTDPSQIVVQFGDRTASITSLSDTEIVVVVPPGPMTGGDVRVRVGTASGFTDGTYTYAVGAPDDQIAYIQVNNYFRSCLGGTGNATCGEIGYVGGTGTAGIAERLTFAYPRLQAPSQGYVGGQLDSQDAWAIARGVSATYPAATEDLYANIGDTVKLVNTSDYAQKQDPYCPNLDGTAVYTYPGGADGSPDPYSVQTAFIPGGEDCAEGYDRAELNFCQRDNEYGVPTNQYNADWPITHDFFASVKESNDPEPVTVELTAEGVGLADVALNLPEPVTFYNTQGFDDGDGNNDGAAEFWDVPDPSFAAVDHCFSDDGAGESLADVAMRFEWAPTKQDLSTGGPIESGRTFVRISFNLLSVGWFGAASAPVTAVLTVPDDNNYDKSTKMASLDVPSSVLYQLPTSIYPTSGTNLLAKGSPEDALLFMELQRVTEYTMVGEDGKHVVFQYVTGSFTYFDWTNPLDDDCHDCLDGDDDGWTDEDDPDCDEGTSEVGYGTDACNDGLDNDDDGREDSRDEDCESASDDDESNCDNNKDDDGDGLKDEDDPDCQEGGGGNEASVAVCEDGEDNDADGWTDADDPDCVSGDEELGLGVNACNDGVDNDGDGLSDRDDPQCVDADDADESNCDDGVDNDADGLTDAEDDECLAGGNESTTVTGCSDGVDEDGDGWVDGADPDCLVGTEEVGLGTTQCNDSIDNDVDSSTDSADADCVDASDDDESS